MKYQPFEIGPVKVDPPVLLAPMAGYTDSAMRSVCAGFNCGMTFTEMVNSGAIVFGSRRTFHLLESGPVEHPLGVNLYGCDPGVMAEAASIIEKRGGVEVIDINCGCPVHKIAAKGMGAALMKKPGLIADIVKAVSGSVTLPVTVKTRTGMCENTESIDEVAAAAEESGAAAISIHARPASRKHGGAADWDIIARVKAAARIPVIGNGGIAEAADAPRMFEYTGVDGVMVGRAAIGNPWIFREIDALLGGAGAGQVTTEERRAVILRHLELLIKLKEKERKLRRRKSMPADSAAVLHFRSQFIKYISGLPGCDRVRRNLQEMNSVESLTAALDSVL